MQYEIGLVGLAVMGQNLALNMAGKGFPVAVYNRTTSKVDDFINDCAGNLPIGGAYSLPQLATMLSTPRKIMLMVKAGQPVDDMIEELLPFLDPGDILIDGGNSFFLDTVRRTKKLQEKDIRFVGVGVSGGEEGALFGPSLMPGGDLTAYKLLAPLFSKIAAQVDGEPCCSYVGADGAGHYVKMVHNGIEYGDMQLISEAYFIMNQALGMTAQEIHAVFAEWNKGELNSYLIEITRDILAKKDDITGRPLLDMILDTAEQKGTGKWTSQNALELGVPTPTITAAVFARCMSAYKSERVVANKILPGPPINYSGNKQEYIQAIHDALYASKICSYAQGFALLMAAGKAYGWNFNYGEVALLWRGGCIIRAQFLDRIQQAFVNQKTLPNLLLDKYFRAVIERSQANWRLVVKSCKEWGLPIPALVASLDYYDAYRSAVLPTNMIQAQRDYFGAHTFQRKDQEGWFHAEWLNR